jgi:WD40 repeat protein
MEGTMPLRRSFILIFGAWLVFAGSKALPQITPNKGTESAGRRKKPAALDCFGDPLPAGALARLGTTRFRHGSTVHFVAFLGHGEELITASSIEGLQVWDVATGREIRRIGPPPDLRKGSALEGPVVNSIALTGDRKTLVQVRPDGTIHGWDIATGKECYRFVTKAAPRKKEEDRTHWKVGGPPMLNSEAVARGWAVSLDGNVVAVRDQAPVIHLLDARTGKELRQQKVPLLNTWDENDIMFTPADGLNRNYLSQVAFSAQGKVLVSFDVDWDRPPPNEHARLVAVGLVTLIEAKTGKVLRQLKIPGASSPSLAISPDGSILAVALQRGWESAGTLRLYDATNGKELTRLGVLHHTSAVADLVFSTDGKKLAATDEFGKVRLWHVVAAKERQLQGPWPKCKDQELVNGFHNKRLAFSPDGKTLAAALPFNLLRLWDVETGKELLPTTGHQGPVAGLAIAPDGRTVTTCGADLTVRRWAIDSGKELSRLQLPPDVESWILTPDGREILVLQSPSIPDWILDLCDLILSSRLSTRTPLSLLEITTGNKLWRLADVKELGILAISPNGTTVALRDQCYEHKVRLWNRDSGAARPGPASNGLKFGLVYTPAEGIEGCVAFSGDGRQYALASVQTGTTTFKDGKVQEGAPGGIVSLWDQPSGLCSFRFDTKRQGGFSSLVFSPDSRTLVAVDEDNRLSLWEAASGRRRCLTEGEVTRPAFSADGRFLAAGSLYGEVYIWDAWSGKKLKQFAGHSGKVLNVAFTPDGQRLVSTGADSTILVWSLGEFPTPPRGQVTLQVRELERLWAELAEDDAAKAFAAASVLARVAEQTVPWLRDRLRPVAPGQMRPLEHLLKELDSDQYALRARASSELTQRGSAAAVALQKLLASSPSLEAKRRAEPALAKAISHVPSGQEIQGVRAVEVLERIGTSEGGEVLQSVARGAPEARLTQEATAALGRLAKRHMARR